MTTDTDEVDQSDRIRNIIEELNFGDSNLESPEELIDESLSLDDDYGGTLSRTPPVRAGAVVYVASRMVDPRNKGFTQETVAESAGVSVPALGQASRDLIELWEIDNGLRPE